MVVPNAVDALPDLLLREAGARVLGRERLDGTLFGFDVALDLAAGAYAIAELSSLSTH